MTGGVYTITAPSGHQYVGSTISFARRWRSHRSKLRNGHHPSRALTAAFRKYGEEALVYRQVLVCEPAMLEFYEQNVIDALKPKYNARAVAASNRGHRHSPETRAAMAAARKNQTLNAEARARMSAGSKGKPRSAAQKAALLKAQARARSPEAVAKRLATLAPVFGSTEYRAELSARATDQMAKTPRTKEWRDKVSAGTKAGITAAKAMRTA